jgi:hypothetical protein
VLNALDDDVAQVLRIHRHEVHLKRGKTEKAHDSERLNADVLSSAAFSENSIAHLLQHRLQCMFMVHRHRATGANRLASPGSHRPW